MMVRKLVTVAVQLVLLTTFALAQGVATGDLHVMVKDPKGDLVTNATVTARDESKALERSTSDNAEGRYRILLVASGYLHRNSRGAGFRQSHGQECCNRGGNDVGNTDHPVGGRDRRGD